MGLRANLDILEKPVVSCPYQKLNPELFCLQLSHYIGFAGQPCGGKQEILTE